MGGATELLRPVDARGDVPVEPSGGRHETGGNNGNRRKSEHRFRRRQSTEMTIRQKMILGAVGAVTPLALNLLVVDQLTLVGSARSSPASDTRSRLLVLVGLGSLVVYLNIDEANRMRIFQLGVAAPALVTALMNGANQRALLQNQQFVTLDASIFVATLQAQESPAEFIPKRRRANRSGAA